MARRTELLEKFARFFSFEAFVMKIPALRKPWEHSPSG